MRHTITLVLGMILLVLGVQSAIRLTADHENGGLLGELPGGFPVLLTCYVVIGAAGAGLAGWGSRGAKRTGRAK
ncbi:hypothetical protein [Nocardia sp. NPDC056000]|uniref:hypothetical protein n=1 Tax=Nocardia sp. NPDC056000 TaxID=3345674 RepID=UPI0035D5DAF9